MCVCKGRCVFDVYALCGMLPAIIMGVALALISDARALLWHYPR